MVETENPSLLNFQMRSWLEGQLKILLPRFRSSLMFIAVIQNYPWMHLEIPVILGWLCQSNFRFVGTRTKKRVNFVQILMGRAIIYAGSLRRLIMLFSSGIFNLFIQPIKNLKCIDSQKLLSSKCSYLSEMVLMRLIMFFRPVFWRSIDCICRYFLDQVMVRQIWDRIGCLLIINYIQIGDKIIE